ncbi:MAG: phospho-N-acetylmuramoyl-pentapeptide-transferase [Pirellulales bacterium]
MLLWFLQQCSLIDASVADSLAKITLRASLAALASFLLGVTLGPRMIRWLAARFREPNHSPSRRIEKLHAGKHHTPTMGGLFLVMAIIGSALVCGDLTNGYVLTALFALVGLTLVGMIDDLAKLSGRQRGVAPRTKLAAQIALAAVVALWLYRLHVDSHGPPLLHVPIGGAAVHLGLLFVPLAMLVIVATSNAVNLTDGLDGLAGGCLVFATCGMGAVAYLAGHRELAEYLSMPHIAGSGEMVVLAGGMVGGLLGFLWFNCHPAQVFMGDTGSLPLGGMLAVLALVARQELVLVLIGGVFVAEAVSVIAQVISYRWRRRRVLLCAPLHHHFQFCGWPESRIVTRFWIAAALCSILGLASLRLHIRPSSKAAVSPSLVGAVASGSAEGQDLVSAVD